MRNLIGTASALAMIVATGSPAFAAVTPLQPTPEPNAAHVATMTANCNALAALLGPTTVGPHNYYTVAYVVTAAVDGDPVLAGNRANVDGTWTPDTTSIQTLNGADASASTQLVRNGKSPNIFATDVRASSETWSNNSVDFTADYTITTTSPIRAK